MIEKSQKRKRILDWTYFGLGAGFIYATASVARSLQISVSRSGGDQFLTGGPALIIFALLAVSLWWLLFRKGDFRLPTLFLLTNLGIAYYLMLSSLTAIPIERVHLIEYGLLSYLAYRCSKNYYSGFIAYALAALLVFDAGFIDEIIQHYLPDRVYDTRDVITNGLSGILGLSAVWILSRPLSDQQNKTENQDPADDNEA